MSAMRKRNKRLITEKIVDLFDIPTSVLPWGLDLEIKNDREVYVDGCTGISEYSNDRVVFAGKGMEMIIYGDEFQLYTFADERLRLCGRITKIEIVRH